MSRKKKPSFFKERFQNEKEENRQRSPPARRQARQQALWAGTGHETRRASVFPRMKAGEGGRHETLSAGGDRWQQPQGLDQPQAGGGLGEAAARPFHGQLSPHR